MRKWTLRLGLSLLVVLAFWANHLPAQEVFVVPAIPYEPARQPYAPSPLDARPAPAPSSSPFQRAINKHGLGCGVDPYYSQCGNFRSEFLYVFGSCRYFFRESCPPNQPCADKRYQR